MISVSLLNKRFGNRNVLKDLDLNAQSGEIVGLTGINGAGKTTLIRILATLIKADSGSISMDERTAPVEIRSRIGVVLHQPMIYGDLTARENLRFSARLNDLNKAASRIEEALRRVDLESRKNDLVRNFSRGMQQRLSIARAILHDPPILLMDEPFTGLDEESSTRVEGLLRDFSQAGKTVLVTSHDLERILNVSTRMDILHIGRVILSVPTKSTNIEKFTAQYKKMTCKKEVVISSEGHP